MNSTMSPRSSPSSCVVVQLDVQNMPFALRTTSSRTAKGMMVVDGIPPQSVCLSEEDDYSDNSKDRSLRNAAAMAAASPILNDEEMPQSESSFDDSSQPTQQVYECLPQLLAIPAANMGSSTTASTGGSKRRSRHQRSKFVFIG